MCGSSSLLSVCCISNALFTVVGHRKIAVPPGAFVPMIIKAVGWVNRQHRPGISQSVHLADGMIYHPYFPLRLRRYTTTQPVIVGGPSATAPACSTATSTSSDSSTSKASQTLASPIPST